MPNTVVVPSADLVVVRMGFSPTYADQDPRVEQLVRAAIDATLAMAGYHGILAFALPEALWLAGTASSTARTRTDLLATRIGTPPARTTRSSAL